MRRLVCLVLLLISASLGSGEDDVESDKVKTTAAVLKAIERAESKHDSKKEDEQASAVADATLGVIRSESDAGVTVPEGVLAKAKGEAMKTFKELDDDNVGAKVAADAAAKVAVAEVDGASGLDLKKGVKENAEQAAVAAATGLADHPHNGFDASLDAVGIVEKEERTGNVDVAEKTLIAKAKDVVSDLPSMTEGAVRNTTNSVGFLGTLGLLSLLGVGAAIGYRTYKDRYEETPYMKSLRLIREEYQGSDDFRKDVEFGEPDLQYMEMR